MRRVLAPLALAWAVAGCSGSFSPTGPDPAAQGVHDPGSDGGDVAAASSFGVDDVPNTAGAAKRLALGQSGSDEINTATDVDWYVFHQSAHTPTRVSVAATPQGQPAVSCAVYYKTGLGYSQLATTNNGSPGTCLIWFTPSTSRDWYVKVWGAQGAHGPSPVEIVAQ